MEYKALRMGVGDLPIKEEIRKKKYGLFFLFRILHFIEPNTSLRRPYLPFYRVLLSYTIIAEGKTVSGMYRPYNLYFVLYFENRHAKIKLGSKSKTRIKNKKKKIV